MPALANQIRLKLSELGTVAELLTDKDKSGGIAE
jgi:hypothetical protein